MADHSDIDMLLGELKSWEGTVKTRDQAGRALGGLCARRVSAAQAAQSDLERLGSAMMPESADSHGIEALERRGLEDRPVSNDRLFHFEQAEPQDFALEQESLMHGPADAVLLGSSSGAARSSSRALDNPSAAAATRAATSGMPAPSSFEVSMERQVEALLTEDAMMQTLVGASEPGAQIPRADRLAPVKSPPGVECLLQDSDGQGGRTNEVSPNVQSEPAQLPGQKQPRGRTGCVLA